MSGASPDPTPGQMMDMHVSQARARLSDGALVRETLEYLWRTAYAVGVRAGQAPGERKLGSPEASERAQRVEQADKDGWRYGTPWRYMPDMKTGSRFSYGGVDREGPNCDRPAVLLPVGPGASARMELGDTGERVRVPAICWTRPAEEGRDDGEL